MSKKKFHLGFLGGGINSTIGNIHHLASKLDGRWNLTSGFFSRNKKINHKSALSYDVDLKRTYSNFNDFIKNEKYKIDAVALLVPTPERYDYLQKLSKYKIPIISEKPLVENYSQCLKLEKLFKVKNFLRVTYNYTGYPLIKELREIIKKGYLGKIKQIHFEMPQDSFTNLTSKKIFPKKWRLKDNGIPNISHDLGSHLVSLIYFLLDEYPSSVICDYFKSSKFKNLIDNGYFWLNFKSGIKGTFWISKSTPGVRNGLKIRIFGEKKGSQWLQNRPEELLIYNENGSLEKIDNLTLKLTAHLKKYNRYKVGHPAGFLEAFANLYSEYADQLEMFFQNKKKLKDERLFDLKNSTNISKFFKAASKANKNKKWTKI